MAVRRPWVRLQAAASELEAIPSRVWASLCSCTLSFVLAATLSGGLATGATGQEEAEATLEVVNLDLLDSRDGFAVPPDSIYAPGEAVHLVFQVRGYRIGQEDRIRLTWEVEALDPQGRDFYRSERGNVDVELAPQDKNWMPIVRYSPRIPDHASGGRYTLRLAVRDELADLSVEAEVPLRVEGTELGSFDHLTVREFQFVLDEHDATVVQPVFRAGERIWARFFITGYKMRDDHTYSVESDAWVVNAEGQVMFSFEQGGDQGRPYYPRLWLPATMRMDLQETIPPGRYEVVLQVRDAIGQMDVTERFGFVVN